MARSMLVIALIAAAGLAACTRPDGTPDTRMNSAMIGAAGGAMIGSAISGDSEGALIGAAGGAGLGALAGADQERQQGVRY
jgi:Glycine zipper